jgi:hypothetical protein
MSDKIECLKIALDINKFTHNYDVEGIVKTAEKLYAFVEAKPELKNFGTSIDKDKNKYPR